MFGGRHGTLWPWQRALGEIAPQLRWHGDGAAPSPSMSRREVLAAAVVEAVAEAAQRRPLLVVLEDLHWDDPASLTVLRAVVDAVPALAAMLLLTCRDEPLETSPQVSDQLADLPAGVRRIPLSPIDEDAVADLAGSVVGRTLSDRDVRDLHVRRAATRSSSTRSRGCCSRTARRVRCGFLPASRRCCGAAWPGSASRAPPSSRQPRSPRRAPRTRSRRTCSPQQRIVPGRPCSRSSTRRWPPGCSTPTRRGRRTTTSGTR